MKANCLHSKILDSQLPATYQPEAIMDSFTIETLRADHDADFRAWESFVDKSPTADVYFRPGYVWACREAGTQSVVGVVINACGFRCLLPFLVAETPDRVKYAYSPYGYGGLLPLESELAPTREQVIGLRAALQQWSRKNSIVCVVIRMHPLLRQELWFEVDPNEDAITLLGNETVSVTLNPWNEEGQAIATLNKGRRSDLKVARRSLRLSWDCGWNDESRNALQKFQVIYNDQMRNLGARDFYFFPDTYYLDLARGLDQRLAIGLAWRDDQVVGGALFMADTNFAHYHLSASNLVGYEFKASTLLVNEGASWARRRGCSQIHLGGGVMQDDTLFRFKQSFGGATFRYGTVTIVANNVAFKSMCQTPDAPWPFAMHRYVVPCISPSPP